MADSPMVLFMNGVIVPTEDCRPCRRLFEYLLKEVPIAEGEKPVHGRIPAVVYRGVDKDGNMIVQRMEAGLEPVDLIVANDADARIKEKAGDAFEIGGIVEAVVFEIAIQESQLLEIPDLVMSRGIQVTNDGISWP